MTGLKRALTEKAANDLRRLSWKKAMKSLFGAPWRIHHYRDVHTGMLREALCNLDCGSERRGCDDE